MIPKLTKRYIRAEWLFLGLVQDILSVTIMVAWNLLCLVASTVHYSVIQVITSFEDTTYRNLLTCGKWDVT
jgi:hypothetical protein